MRTGSTPFSLMYARRPNDFEDFRQVYPSESISDALKHITAQQQKFLDIIIPALLERTYDYKAKMRHELDTNRKQLEVLKPGQLVMARDETRDSKWNPYYEGPFEIVSVNEGNAYTLKDKTNVELTRKYTINQLKPVGWPSTNDLVDSKNLDSSGNVQTISDADRVSNSEKSVNLDSDYFDIEEIVGHRKSGKRFQYLVKWKGYDTSQNSWVHENDFMDVTCIKEYWDKHRPQRITRSTKKK
jgi:hypothetical protein